MDHFKRDLIEATFDQLTKSQHEVLGYAVPSPAYRDPNRVAVGLNA